MTGANDSDNSKCFFFSTEPPSFIRYQGFFVAGARPRAVRGLLVRGAFADFAGVGSRSDGEAARFACTALSVEKVSAVSASGWLAANALLFVERPAVSSLLSSCNGSGTFSSLPSLGTALAHVDIRRMDEHGKAAFSPDGKRLASNSGILLASNSASAISRSVRRSPGGHGISGGWFAANCVARFPIILAYSYFTVV